MSDPDDVVVNGPVLERDAEQVWQAAADTLAAMVAKAPTIAPVDFSGLSRAQEVARDWAAARADLISYIEGGKSEMLAFERLLLQTVLIYDEAHGAAVADIERIKRELAE